MEFFANEGKNIEIEVNGKTFDFGTLLNEDTTIVAIWREN